MSFTINIFGGIRIGCREPELIRFVPRLGTFQTSDDSVKVAKSPRRPFIKGNLIMAFEMNNEQQVTVAIQPQTHKGKPAKLDGVPEWLSDNSDVVTLVPSADGLSCLIKANGIPGSANVQVTGDADLGAGVSPIVGTIAVTITQAPATKIVISPGTPEDQPDDAPPPSPPAPPAPPA